MAPSSSSSAEEVGEEKRDFLGKVETQEAHNEPWTSAGIPSQVKDARSVVEDTEKKGKEQNEDKPESYEENEDFNPKE